MLRKENSEVIENREMNKVIIELKSERLFKVGSFSKKIDVELNFFLTGQGSCYELRRKTTVVIPVVNYY